MTEIGTFRLSLPGSMLRRGFWLYVWRVVASDDTELFYVGRTGDNSSPNASPAFIRLGQHLVAMSNANSLRRHLAKWNIEAETCVQFDFIAHGPIYPETIKPLNFKHSDKVARSTLMDAHIPVRNIVGAMEKRLASDLMAAGYKVMNVVKWKHDVPDVDWIPVREAFSVDFPKLKGIS